MSQSRSPGWPVWLYVSFVCLAGPFLLFPNHYTPIFLILLPVFWLLVLAKGRCPGSPLQVPLLLLLVAVIFSGALAVDPSLGQAKLAGVILGVAVAQALSCLEPRETNLRRVAWLLLFVGAATAVAGLLGTAWITYKSGLPSAFYERLPRLFAAVPGLSSSGFHPNEVGGTLALVLPLALAFSMRKTNLPLRLAACLVLLFVGAVLVLSQSRSALFGTAVASFLMLAVIVKGLRYVALAIGGASSVYLVTQNVESLKSLLIAFDRASSYPGSINFASRLEIWQRGLYVVRDFPFTGIGLGSFPAITLERYPYFLAEVDHGYGHAHNFFLETAIDFGVGGLIVALIVFATFGRMLWCVWLTSTSETGRTMAIGLAGGIAAHILFGLTDAVNWGAKPGGLFWTYLGAGALVWGAANRPLLLDLQVVARRFTARLPVIGNNSPDTKARHPSALKLAGGAGLLALAAVIVFRGPLLSAFENNLAARELGRVALLQGGDRARYDASGTLAAGNRLPLDGSVERAHSYLEAALARDPGNVAALRNLSSVYSTRSDYARAANALLRATTLEPGHLLAQYELARAYTTIGKTDLALPLYRGLIARFPGNAALKEAEVNDRVFGQAKAGVERLSSGDPSAALTEFRLALAVRPGELLTSAYLAQTLTMAGKEEEAATAYRELHNFTLSSDGRMYELFLSDLLPVLAKQGFLHSGELDRIASFLLMKDVVDPAAPLFDFLVKERPGDKETWLLRAELRARQGSLVEAASDLERALALDPRNAEAYFRLGKLTEPYAPERALAAYRQALSIDPSSSGVTSALATLMERQGRAVEDTGPLREPQPGDGRAVAQKLGIVEGDIVLVPAGLANANFRDGQTHPTHWRWVQWIGGQFFGGGFFGGSVDERERYEGERSVHIAGLWGERRPGGGNFWLDASKTKEVARAGYRGSNVTLGSRSLYALSFAYKTANWRTGTARATILVPDLDGGPTDFLPDTAGRWQRRTFLFANARPNAVEASPLLTSWGVGDLWFADVRLAKVIPESGSLLWNMNVAVIN